jgi:hypothetical protein
MLYYLVMLLTGLSLLITYVLAAFITFCEVSLSICHTRSQHSEKTGYFTKCISVIQILNMLTNMI